MASVRAVRSTTVAMASATATVHLQYWLSVVPVVRRESQHWHQRALQIPDPSLRRPALQTQRVKKSNVEGAGAFAILAPPAHRMTVLRATVAFQSMYDYADTLSEEPSEDPILNAGQLHQALLVAVSRDAPHRDYYAHHRHRDDDGYLAEMVDACRSALRELPSYHLVADIAAGLSERFVRYQSLNLSEHLSDHRALAQWARGETPASSALCWWETAASAGSSLGLFALIAAAAQPDLSPAEAAAIRMPTGHGPALCTYCSTASPTKPWTTPPASGVCSTITPHRRKRPRDCSFSPPKPCGARASFQNPISTRRSSLAWPPPIFPMRHRSHQERSSSLRAVLEAMGPIVKPSMFIFRARRRAARVSYMVPIPPTRMTLVI